ncbi:MAG TPA: S9 family peptidase [Parvularculaceae bacterium]|nr:S9 family peptidase [Parvularculaceae bacterium]
MFRRDPFAAARKITPPRIESRRHRIRQHGKARIDSYAWLKSENWRDVLADPEKLPTDIRGALEAENAYYEKVTADLAELREALYAEMRGRIKEDDSSVPLPDGPWRYWAEYRKDGEYPQYRRAPRDGGEPVTLFDGDAEKHGSAFFSIGGVHHSPDHRLLAYAVDRVGSENYEIRIREVATGVEYEEVIGTTTGEVVWTANSAAFFYVERDDQQRPRRVKLHRLGEPPDTDALVYEEEDHSFFVGVSETQSRAFILIESHTHETTETRVVPADAPDKPPVLIVPRDEGVEYSLEHRGDKFYILTNADGAVDFKIVSAPVSAPGRENWKDHIPHRAGTFIKAFTVYERFLVHLELKDALPRLVIETPGGASHEIAFDESAFALSFSGGYEFDPQMLRFTYTSPSTPAETYDYDMEKRARFLLKTQEIPSGHDKSRYKVERIEARAPDGAMVPVTILRLAGSKLNGQAPLILYGYGAYGLTVPADFSATSLSLVDRGAIYAIAHVRGGAERGRQWYLDGKMKQKPNSFTDFIAAAEGLIAKRYTSAGKIVAFGGSAGGLLVGAAVNQRPGLFGAVLAAVPFVDVLNTISDETLPLTQLEWPEWGNPVASVDAYRWIAGYSPYENVRNKTYPPVMATGGIADARVTYWEPAKWIAELQRVAKGGPFVLRMNMEAGHAGAAARFKRLDEQAHLYAFALKAMGLKDARPAERK